MCTSWSDLLDELEELQRWNEKTLEWDPPTLSYRGEQLIAFIRRHLNEETP